MRHDGIPLRLLVVTSAHISEGKLRRALQGGQNSNWLIRLTPHRPRPIESPKT